MPIPFSLIPAHIQHSILPKFGPRDFRRFLQSSKKSYEIGRKIKTRIIFDAKYLSFAYDDNATFKEETVYIRIKRRNISPSVFKRVPVRIATITLRIHDTLTNEYCQYITNFLLLTQSSTVSLEIDNINCNPESFNGLVEASHALKLVCFEALPAKFLKVPALKNIDDLVLYKSEYNDTEVLAIKRARLELAEAPMTSGGINTLLKQWLNCERDITKLSITSSIDVEDTVIFDEIPHTLVVLSNMRQEHTYTVYNTRKAEMLVVDIKMNGNCVSIWSHSTI